MAKKVDQGFFWVLISWTSGIVYANISEPEKPPLVGMDSFKKHESNAPGSLCAWSSSDVKRVDDAMFKILRAVSLSWVSWRNLKGAVCKTGSLELLNFCLKELGGKQSTDGMIVHSRCNPTTGALEYSLKAGSNAPKGEFSSNSPTFPTYPSHEHVIRDMKFLYESLLHPHTMLNFVKEAKRSGVLDAASRILDCKQFVKDYESKTENPSMMYLLCHVQLIDQFKEHGIRPPPELITLSSNATIANLKTEVSKVFQEVYVMFKGFKPEELVDFRGVEDSTQVSLLFKPFEKVSIRGRCPVKNRLGHFSVERGIESWTVDCSCGTRDDDGERMLACDICGVWQHTRCVGIPDFETTPPKFVCIRCWKSCMIGFGNITMNCKDESMAVGRNTLAIV